MHVRGLIGICFSVLVASCSSGPETDYFKGDTMGTFYTVRFWSEKNVRAHKIGTVIDELLNQFEDELSNWRAGSWINRFNDAPAGEYIAAPKNAFQVLSLCLELAKRSDGLLDPTISPLIELWGFGTANEHTVPDTATIQETLQKVGYQKLVLDDEKQAVLKTQAELQLNCSAVAKGYAVDLIARLLQENGIDHFLINIGGEISARGSNPDGNPWKVGINQPALNGRDGKTGKTISLTNRSLATSGHSQRTFMVEGQRYSHILNPKTGRPVSTDIASATVLAPSCALADGLATLALILDEDAMQELLESYDDVEVFRTSWGVEGTENRVGRLGDVVTVFLGRPKPPSK